MTEPLKATQLSKALVNTTSQVLQYTVPAGKAIILKSIVMVATGAANTVQINIGPTAARIVTWPLGAFGTVDGNVELRRWIVLPAGGTISAAMGATGSCWLTLSGSLLYV